MRGVDDPSSVETRCRRALAFDGICGSLHVPYDARECRRLIAARVIEVARDGELDPANIYGRILRERMSKVA